MRTISGTAAAAPLVVDRHPDQLRAAAAGAPPAGAVEAPGRPCRCRHRLDHDRAGAAHEDPADVTEGVGGARAQRVGRAHGQRPAEAGDVEEGDPDEEPIGRRSRRGRSGRSTEIAVGADVPFTCTWWPQGAAAAGQERLQDEDQHPPAVERREGQDVDEGEMADRRPARQKRRTSRAARRRRPPGRDAVAPRPAVPGRSAMIEATSWARPSRMRVTCRPSRPPRRRPQRRCRVPRSRR